MNKNAAAAVAKRERAKRELTSHASYVHMHTASRSADTNFIQ